MRATILAYAIILTKAHRATLSMMAKGRIVARVLPLRRGKFCNSQLPPHVRWVANLTLAGVSKPYLGRCQ